jgi:two-component system response regulator AtoC
LLSETLREAGYLAKIEDSGNGALKEVRKNIPDIVLLDISLPDIDGMRVLEELKKDYKELSIIMLTASGDIKTAVEAIKAGAFDYITKPFDQEELLVVIKRALQNRDLNKEMQYLRSELAKKSMSSEIIGESPELKQILKKAKIIASTNMTVVIHGESGVGKELIADMIHRESSRKEKPYVPIDCGAIAESLVESELFGHEKGAFTGAYAARKGKFEQAHGGTLFLDEVTNLPESVQAKLLRVLEERKIWYVGGNKAVNIDVRIIAATNIDIASAVKQNKFRGDLFHRLNEFNIFIPPLRERKDDIIVIANYFIEQANNEFNKKIKGIAPDALKMLLNYRWPGNIRELKNIIRMAVLSAESENICPADLPVTITVMQHHSANPEFGEEISLDSAINNFEARLIRDALKQVDGNKVKAASILQIDRKASYRKMDKLGIS